MNTKWNLLMVAALLAMLVGGHVGRAQAQDVITFIPDALPNAIVGIAYQQTLSLSGATKPGGWEYTPDPNDPAKILPPGMSVGDMGYGMGMIDGVPERAGTFAFTVLVWDYYDPLDPTKYAEYSHEYTLVVEKATPTIEVSDTLNPSTVGNHFVIKAEALFRNRTNPPGTFAFYLDDSSDPVTGCEALAVGEINLGITSCTFPDNIAGGDHMIKAVYSPTDSANYDQAEASLTHTIGYKIAGTLFRDANNNGTWDPDEMTLGWYTVGLDWLCDGSVEQTAIALSDGKFSLPNLSPNAEYCLRYIASPGVNFVQTTPTGGILLDENKNIPVGVYFIAMKFSPGTLPAGEKGVLYEQQITVEGGIPPYTITVDSYQTSLPDGLSFDPSTGMLSGTPTQAGIFFLVLDAEDQNGNAAPRHYYTLIIKVEGDFHLVSSPNPSVPGEAVTFTVSATGDAVWANLGPVPPVGTVTFDDNGVAIPGCSDMYLNVVLVSGDAGDFPAVCTTSVLTDGSHVVTAAYTDLSGVYQNAILTVDQVVIGKADLRVTLTDSQDRVQRGGSLTYTMVVQNNGPDPAEGLSAKLKLDPFTAYNSVLAPEGWTCTHPGTAKDGTVTCAGPSLAGGESTTINITVTVSQTVKIGRNLVATATVASTTLDPALKNNTAVHKTLVVQ